MTMRAIYHTSFFALLVFAWVPSRADIYAYTDEHGVQHFTDAPHDARYRLLLVEPKPTPLQAAAHPTSNVMPMMAGEPLQVMILSAATKHRVEPALIQAVIQVESSFNPRAVSPKGAQGLMQLMPATAQRLGVADAFDPAQNIDGGVRYLADLMALFKNDLRLALAAYNAGENAVIQYGRKVPPYRETQDYVPKVLEFYRRFQAANRRI